MYEKELFVIWKWLIPYSRILISSTSMVFVQLFKNVPHTTLSYKGRPQEAVAWFYLNAVDSLSHLLQPLIQIYLHFVLIINLESLKLKRQFIPFYGLRLFRFVSCILHDQHISHFSLSPSLKYLATITNYKASHAIFFVLFHSLR
jgi:hypothetical protein